MGKKISLGAAIAFMAIVAAATFTITFGMAQRNFNEMVSNMKEREKRYSKIAEIDEAVRTNYVDAGALDQTELLDALSAGYLAGTGDKYAKYYTAKEYEELQNSPSKEKVQIGIVAAKDESGYIKVQEVYPDSPAQAADVQPGDLIVKIDDTDITAETYDAAVGLLYGSAGTQMTVTVRKGTEESALVMTRRYVEVPSVSETLLEHGIGLISFREFNANTPDQFNKLLSKLMGQGVSALIFDVRSVDKGTLDSASEILDRLMPAGTLVSSTDKSGTVTVLKISDENEVDLPMAVLVNDKTSGEAELFAQVLKDGGKAKVIGTKTAGKGTMQRRYKLVDGSAVELTTARYNPPVSPSFDGEGVKPDYDVRLSEEQALLVASGRSDSDVQLKKAIEILMVAVNASGENASSQLQPPTSSSEGAQSAPEEITAKETFPEEITETPVSSSKDETEPSSDKESSFAKSSVSENSKNAT